jgi:hypothetical protein
MSTKWNSITAIPGSLPGKRTCNGVRGCRITNQPSRSQKQPRITKPMTPTRRANSGRATAIQGSQRRNSLRVRRPAAIRRCCSSRRLPQPRQIYRYWACLPRHGFASSSGYPICSRESRWRRRGSQNDLGIARIDRARRVFLRS